MYMSDWNTQFNILFDSDWNTQFNILFAPNS